MGGAFFNLFDVQRHVQEGLFHMAQIEEDLFVNYDLIFLQDRRSSRMVRIFTIYHEETAQEPFGVNQRITRRFKPSAIAPGVMKTAPTIFPSRQERPNHGSCAAGHRRPLIKRTSPWIIVFFDFDRLCGRNPIQGVEGGLTRGYSGNIFHKKCIPLFMKFQPVRHPRGMGGQDHILQLA